MKSITSLREAREYVDIDFGEFPGGRVLDVTVTCKDCGERAYFKDDPVDAVFTFAARHSACSEIDELIKNQTKEEQQ